MAIQITGENIEQEGNVYRYDLEARDNGNVWNRTFYTTDPNDNWKQDMKNLFLTELGVQVEFESNPLNEDIRDDLGEEYRLIITEMVKYIRQNKATVDESGLQVWFNKRFPNSVFAYEKMVKVVMDKLGAKSFDEVKEVMVSKKFMGVDS